LSDLNFLSCAAAPASPNGGCELSPGYDQSAEKDDFQQQESFGDSLFFETYFCYCMF
jgi:hypothetical protein